MKIVPNNTPEEGMICRLRNGKLFHWRKDFVNQLSLEQSLKIEGCVPIGKLGKTHSIENGRLVEIERDDVCVDDVFEDERGSVFTVNHLDPVEGEDVNHKYGQVIYDNGVCRNKFNFKNLRRKIKNGYVKRIGSLHYSHKIIGG